MQKFNKAYNEHSEFIFAKQLQKISDQLEVIIGYDLHLTEMVAELLSRSCNQSPPHHPFQGIQRHPPFQCSRRQLQNAIQVFQSRFPENSVLDSNYQNSVILSLSPELQDEPENSLIRVFSENTEEDFLQRAQEDDSDQHQLKIQPVCIKQALGQAPVHSQASEQVELANSIKLLELLQQEFSKMSLKFSCCQNLYAYPQMSSQSFYDKITGSSNILLLAQLKSGEIIGAFSEVPFSSKPAYIPKDNPKCCLFNLTRRHYLYASRTNKTHSCDRNYILFGNWEIKIKVGENGLYSDLGQRGDCFRKQGFGPNQPEVFNTREWIFGAASSAQTYQLERYMVCALK